MQRKRMLGLILVVLISAASWGGYRVRRQSALNHDLIVASGSTDPLEVLTLLKRGADPNAIEDRDPEPALRHMLNILLRHKQNFSSTSPLTQAMPDEANTAIRGFVLVKTSAAGQLVVSTPTPLDNTQVEIVRILLEHGANPNIKLRDGMPFPAHWWFEAQDDRLLTLFLQHGANPNRVDDVGNSVLMYAVNSHKEALVKTALDHGANPNLENANGDTALMWAASDHDIEAMKRLLSSRADVNHKNKSGHSALTWAVMNGQYVTWKHGNDPALSERERQDAIDVLLAAGADVNASDRQGCSPFLFALNETHIDVNGMLAHGADVQRALPLSSPTQTFSWTLLGVGGETFSQTTPGTTPLMFAVSSQRVDLVRRLLANGADINVRDAKGKTARYYAETSYTAKSIDAAKIRTLLQNAGAHR